MNLHIRIHHYIVSATRMSFADLEQVYFTQVNIAKYRYTPTHCVKLHFSKTARPFAKQHLTAYITRMSFADLEQVYFTQVNITNYRFTPTHCVELHFLKTARPLQSNIAQLTSHECHLLTLSKFISRK